MEKELNKNLEEFGEIVEEAIYYQQNPIPGNTDCGSVRIVEAVTKITCAAFDLAIKESKLELPALRFFCGSDLLIDAINDIHEKLISEFQTNGTTIFTIHHYDDDDQLYEVVKFEVSNKWLMKNMGLADDEALEEFLDDYSSEDSENIYTEALAEEAIISEKIETNDKTMDKNAE